MPKIERKRIDEGKSRFPVHDTDNLVGEKIKGEGLDREKRRLFSLEGKEEEESPFSPSFFVAVERRLSLT
jgi:hypothetical protein